MTNLEEQLVRAYADERFGLPRTTLTAVVRRRRRRLRVAAVVAGVALATAGVGIALDLPEAAPEPPVGGAATAACYERAGGTGPRPDVGFTFTAPDDPHNPLVVVAGDRLAAACTRDGSTRLSPADAGSGQLDFAYSSNAAHGLMVIGTTPPGTQRVEVVPLPGGTALPEERVQLQDGWFAAWQPAPAYDPDRYRGLRVVWHTATDIDELETLTG